MTDTIPVRLAVATTSGSSGKTTTTVTLAAILAEQGHRILVVDTDWQMDASRWLGIDEGDLDGRVTLFEVLQDRSRIDQAVTASTVPGVDLLPASPELAKAASKLGRLGTERQLRRALDTVEDRYDIILIDCRAGTELPTLAGLVAADAVIGATWAGVKELRNTLSLTEYVDEIADGYDRPLPLVGVLPCNVPATGGAYREALAVAGDMFGDRLLPPVRHSVSVTEAHAQRRQLTSSRRWQAVADDYRAVASALVDLGVLPPTPAKVIS